MITETIKKVKRESGKDYTVNVNGLSQEDCEDIIQFLKKAKIQMMEEESEVGLIRFCCLFSGDVFRRTYASCGTKLHQNKKYENKSLFLKVGFNSTMSYRKATNAVSLIQGKKVQVPGDEFVIKAKSAILSASFE